MCKRDMCIECLHNRKRGSETCAVVQLVHAQVLPLALLTLIVQWDKVLRQGSHAPLQSPPEHSMRLDGDEALFGFGGHDVTVDIVTSGAAEICRPRIPKTSCNNHVILLDRVSNAL
eukprot:126651-Pyramimonas_sp.AAC.1